MTKYLAIELLLGLMLSAAGALCPSRCVCNEHILKTICNQTNLEVVPIQLNPDTHTLILSGNRIAQIDMTLIFYTNLVELNLARNRIRNIGSHNFESQRHLTLLDLSFNLIKALHKDAFRGLAMLTHLNLEGNEIEYIAEKLAFRDLGQLLELNLSRNRLLSISAGVFDPLKHLERLYLKNNSLLAFPDAVSALKSLQKLNLENNLIKSILLPNLPHLGALSLRSNLILELNNESLANAPNLVDLDLSDNNLTSVPTDALSLLSHLRVVNLSRNVIEELKGYALQGVNRLGEVHLDSLYRLKRVDPQLFAGNPNLQIVSMSNNTHWKHLSRHLFANKKMLHHVKLSDNGFSVLHASDLPLDQLHTIRLGKNPFYCNCSLLWLWLLKENQSENVSNPYRPIILDLEDIQCTLADGTGPVPLKQVLRSELACSSPWILWTSISLVLLLAVIVVVVAVFLIRQRIGRRVEHPVEAFAKSFHEDGNRSYYSYTTPSDAFRVNVKCVSNMYAEPGKLGLFMDRKEDTNIYQEPYAAIVHPNRPHIVYV